MERCRFLGVDPEGDLMIDMVRAKNEGGCCWDLYPEMDFKGREIHLERNEVKFLEKNVLSIKKTECRKGP